MEINVPPQTGFVYDGAIPLAALAAVIAGVISFILVRRHVRTRGMNLPLSVITFRALVGAGLGGLAVMAVFTVLQNSANDIRVEQVASEIESESVEIVSVKAINLDPGSDSQLFLLVDGYASPLDCQMVVSRKSKGVFGCADPTSPDDTYTSLSILMTAVGLPVEGATEPATEGATITTPAAVPAP